jgi:hypothetical protein
LQLAILGLSLKSLLSNVKTWLQHVVKLAGLLLGSAKAQLNQAKAMQMRRKCIKSWVPPRIFITVHEGTVRLYLPGGGSM